MDIDEAAKIDGASPLRIYMNIIIPLSKAPLVTVAIFTFTNCWNDFMGPLIYLSSEKEIYSCFRPAFFYRNVYRTMALSDGGIHSPCHTGDNLICMLSEGIYRRD